VTTTGPGTGRAYLACQMVPWQFPCPQTHASDHAAHPHQNRTCPDVFLIFAILHVADTASVRVGSRNTSVLACPTLCPRTFDSPSGLASTDTVRTEIPFCANPVRFARTRTHDRDHGGFPESCFAADVCVCAVVEARGVLGVGMNSVVWTGHASCTVALAGSAPEDWVSSCRGTTRYLCFFSFIPTW